MVSLGLGKVQYYSTFGNNKDGPPKSTSGDAPVAENVVSGPAKANPASSGDRLFIFLLTQVFEMFGVLLCVHWYFLYSHITSLKLHFKHTIKPLP